MSSKKVVGIIPSRYGSTRLPGKPLKPILNVSMIQRVYERSLLCPDLSAVYIATDDERIQSAVEAFGGKAIMTSAGCQSGTDRAAEAVQAIEADIVVNIQGDQPFIDPFMIQECVQPLLEDSGVEMCTLMFPITKPEDLHDPAVVKIVVDLQGNTLYCSRSLIPFPRCETPHSVYEHIGLYVYTKEFLMRMAALPPTPLEQIEMLEQLRVLEHGYKLRCIETKCRDKEFHGFSVDTQEDLARAEAMLRERDLE
jgi:3-deoxy-manno-octulosonate cytidylyltransferase (CMP-KDO synthetase)